MRLCHHCGYSREGLPLAQPCPECGTSSPVETLRLPGSKPRDWSVTPLIVCAICMALFGLANSIGHLFLGTERPPLEARSTFFDWAFGCTLALGAISLAIAYRFRRGAREEWCMDDRDLVVRGTQRGEIIERVPFALIESVRLLRNRAAPPRVELVKRGRAGPSRSILVDLPIATIDELLDLIRERCASSRDAGINDPEAAIQVRLVPNWFSRGAAVACPACGATRPIAAAQTACTCGQPGWPSDWIVIPFGMMFQSSRDQPSIAASPLGSKLFAWLEASRSIWIGLFLGLFLAVPLAEDLATDPGSALLSMAVLLTALIVSQLFPYGLRPRALAVVTDKGMFGIDARQRCDFDETSRVDVTRHGVTITSGQTACQFWGTRSQVKALSDALGARQTRPQPAPTPST